MSDENVLGFPPRYESRRNSGAGGGGGDLPERIIRLEAAFAHFKEIGATKEDISRLELTVQRTVSDAIEKIDQKHANHYKWIMGTAISLLLLVVSTIYLVNKLQ